MKGEVTFWPVALQRPLLRAAFLSGEAGLSAWHAWKSAVDLEHYPDAGSFRLLPRVCRNLRQHGIDDPLVQKLAGIGRQSWFKNQRAFGTLAPHLQRLRAGGVDVVVLGGMALALRCPDYVWEMEPVWSLLTRSQQAVAAFRQLASAGWRAPAPPPEFLLPAYVASRPGQEFRGPDDQRLGLRWQWLPGQADDDLWDAVEPGEVHNVAVSRLGPADHILYVCAEGRPPHAKPLFGRAIDVMFIVRDVDGAVDWARLVREAERRGLVPWVRETFDYIQDALDAPLPPAVLDALAAAPAVSPVGADSVTRPPAPTIRQEMARLWSEYRECSGRLGLGRRLYYFPRYLQYAWRLDSLAQVPRRALNATRFHLRWQASSPAREASRSLPS